MNRYITYLLFIPLFFFISCSKDSDDLLEPEDTFVKYYGGSFINEAYEIVSTTDGGFIFAGKTANSIDKSLILVIKVSASGNEEWSKTYANTNNEEAKDIITSLDGGYIIGSDEIDILGNQTIHISKINESGSLIWKQSYFANDSASIEKVIVTSDNNYLILANSTKATVNNPAGKSDILLIKTDINGAIIWAQQSGFDNDDYGYDLQEKLILGEYVVVGTSTNSLLLGGFGGTDALIFESNNVGNKINAKIFGGASNDAAYEVEVLSDGYLITGETESNGSGSSDFYLLKVEAQSQNLNIIFEKYFGGTGIDRANCITTTSSGDYLIGGSTDSYGEGAFDAFLIKVNGSGNEIYTKTYGGSGDENINDIIGLSDTKIIMLGTNTVGGNQMITLTKAKEDGELN